MKTFWRRPGEIAMKNDPVFQMVVTVWIVGSSAFFVAHVVAALLTRFGN